MLVRQGRILASTFHPELTSDTTVHEHFLKIAATAPEPWPSTSVLFVCVGNCVRSQMAEAIARHYAPTHRRPKAPVLHPLGFIDQTARAVLEERGISMDGQFSKGPSQSRALAAHLTINMSGVPGSSFLKDRAL